MSNLLAPYRIALVAVFGSVLLSFQSFWSDDIYTTTEIFQTILQATGAFLAYVLPNAPGAKFVKLGVMALTASLQVLVAVGEDGDYTRPVWINVAIAAATALGLLFVKNDPEPAVPPTADTSKKVA